VELVLIGESARWDIQDIKTIFRFLAKAPVIIIEVHFSAREHLDVIDAHCLVDRPPLELSRRRQALFAEFVLHEPFLIRHRHHILVRKRFLNLGLALAHNIGRYGLIANLEDNHDVV